jgi:hypothetical protein
MAAETEPTKVITVLKQELPRRTMGLMAGGTIAILDGRVDDRSRAGRLMAGSAELLPLLEQRKILFTGSRMHLNLLCVAGKTVTILYGGMWLLDGL